MVTGPGWGTWGNMVSLTPYPIKAGTPANEVRSMLKDAGFEKATAGDALIFRSDVEAGALVFIRSADRLPCSVTFYVIAQLDAQGNLVQAKGTQLEHGCL